MLSSCRGKPTPQVTPPSPAFVPAIDMIGELKTFEEGLGVQETENFLRYSGRPTSDNRCYFTGTLELPAFYSGLRMVRESEASCTSRSSDYDVFFYPVQAVASGEETITVALAEAPVERMLVVVPHEDFHNQAETRKAPTEVVEAAATLVGFLAASDFAKQKFGEQSTEFQTLDRDASLFLRKSLLVNSYYEQVSAVYASYRSGLITREQTLERKASLFAALQQSCAAILPDPVSFNKCPAVLNNAGLAFDRTYTRTYPIMYELYTSLGRNTPALVQALKRLLPVWPATAANAADLMKTQ